MSCNTSGSGSVPITSQFNVPTINFAVPPKQNSACTGEMTITPGVSEAFNFQYLNNDGMTLNMSGFTLRLVFWFKANEYESLAANLLGNIMLAKDLSITDPYEGTACVMLTDQETLTLAQRGHSSLLFSVYVINSDGDVFLSQMTAGGGRYGMVYLVSDEFPNAETIKHLSVSNP